MSNKTKYRVKSEKFVTRQMGDETVLVPLSDKVADMTNVLTLNDVGGDILKLLENPVTISELLSQLLEIYEIDEATLKQDVEEFIAEGVKKGVVEESLEFRV